MFKRSTGDTGSRDEETTANVPSASVLAFNIVVVPLIDSAVIALYSCANTNLDSTSVCVEVGGGGRTGTPSLSLSLSHTHTHTHTQTHIHTCACEHSVSRTLSFSPTLFSASEIRASRQTD